jgi:serine O-acetyltransferase
MKRLGYKLGLSIPLNVCGKGLSIAHTGSVIINPYAKIGDYCRIHSDVNIGTAAGFLSKAPIIGHCVYIGPGAKIFGDITIGDNVAIGANAVVNKNVPSSVTVAGIPAKVISNKGSINRTNPLLICPDNIKFLYNNLPQE